MDHLEPRRFWLWLLVKLRLAKPLKMDDRRRDDEGELEAVIEVFDMMPNNLNGKL